MSIETRIEGKRGCGYRKPGGLYLISPNQGRNCCKLPFPLTSCPCCGAGIKPARTWTWVDANQLFGQLSCTSTGNIMPKRSCPLESGVGHAGLLWVGEQFYGTPEDFQEEAGRMGISRRITVVPRDFVLGETWVLLAHRKGSSHIEERVQFQDGFRIESSVAVYVPAIFSVFKPIAVEYVVKGDETQEQLVRLEQRGITPVKVINRRATCSTQKGT